MSRLLLLLMQSAVAQLVHQWTSQRGGSSYDYARVLQMDSSDNPIVAGHTGNDLDGHTNAGSPDIFVMKFDNTGAWQWTTQRGGSSHDEANALQVDSSDNPIVAGYTKGDLDGHTSTGNEDIFVMKFDNTGAWQWTTQRGGSGNARAYALQVDSSDNPIVVGYAYSDLDGHTSAGGNDIFVMKFDSAGAWQWTTLHGGSAHDQAYALQVDSSGNPIVAGYTWGSIDGHSNAGNYDIFVMKFDSAGAWQWTALRGGSSSDGAEALQVDSSDNPIVAGWTVSDLDGHTNAGDNDIFVMKFDSTGVWQWTTQRGGSSYDVAYALQMDSSGNLIVAGYTESDLDGHTNAGYKDIFVMKFDSTGVWQWTTQHGGSAHDVAEALQVDSSGNPFLAGYTESDLDGHTNAGDNDIFLMKFETTTSTTSSWTSSSTSLSVTVTQTTTSTTSSWTSSSTSLSVTVTQTSTATTSSSTTSTQTSTTTLTWSTTSTSASSTTSLSVTATTTSQTSSTTWTSTSATATTTRTEAPAKLDRRALFIHTGALGLGTLALYLIAIMVPYIVIRGIRGPQLDTQLDAECGATTFGNTIISKLDFKRGTHAMMPEAVANSSPEGA